MAEGEQGQSFFEQHGTFIGIVAGIAVLVFLLAFFIVPSFFIMPVAVEQECFFGSGIECVSFKLSRSGALKVVVANGFSERVKITQASCSSSNQSFFEDMGVFIDPHETAELSLNCRNDAGGVASGSPGTAFHGLLELHYEYGYYGEERDATGVLTADFS